MLSFMWIRARALQLVCLKMSLLLDEWWVLSSHNHRTTKAAKKSKRPLFIWLLSHLQQQILLIFVCKVCLMNKSTFHIDLPITELCWYSITQKCIDVHYLLVCLSVLALQWIGKALCLIWQLVYPPAKLDRQLTGLMNDIDWTQLKLNMPFWYGTIISIIVLILTYLQDVQCDLDSCLYVHTTRCHEKVQYRSAFFFDNLSYTSHTYLWEKQIHDHKMLPPRVLARHHSQGHIPFIYFHLRPIPLLPDVLGREIFIALKRQIKHSRVPLIGSG